VGLACLISILVIRSLLLISKQVAVEPAPSLVLNTQVVTEHLAQSTRFRTISSQDPSFLEPKAFLQFHDYLAHSFPNTHRALKREIIGKYSLLFTWHGREKDLKPVLFLAHLDVVPVEGGTDVSWAYPPFAGEIEEGYIWGRGSLDDKVSVLGMLEAVERLLDHGYQPRRTLYFAFGHDEEIGGNGGAGTIAALLQSRTVELEFILDEGGAITDGILSGVSRPVALIGIAEKGYVSLEVTVKGEGGHSSMPSQNSAVDILISALHRLGKQPFPGKIEGGMHHLMEFLAPEMPFIAKTVLANQWLLGFLVTHKLGLLPATNAGIRTTLAVTIIEGGTKENVLPMNARAILNLRILPGDTIKSVMSQVRQVIDDPRVFIRIVNSAREPSPESHINSWAFRTLQRTIGEIFPKVLVAPFLVTGATDSFHYRELVPKGTYRFSPIWLKPADLNRIHGTNERISIENYENGDEAC